MFLDDTPFVLISVVVVNTAAFYYGSNPRQHSTSTEQNRYSASRETRDWYTPISRYNIPIRKGLNMFFGACNVYAMLAGIYPALPYPTFLFPNSPRTANFHMSQPFVLGSSILLIGTYIRFLCYERLGRFFTYQLSIQDNHRLITDGPYGVVRHPSYLGGVMMFAAIMVLHLFSPGTWWIECGLWDTMFGKLLGMWWLGSTAINVLFLLERIPKEDLMLQRTFKEEWDQWAQRTPYVLVPYQVPIRQAQNLVFGALSVYAILASAYPQLHRPALLFPEGSRSPEFSISPTFLFGTFLCCTGGYIRILCYQALGRFFTYELSVKNDHRLVTIGPYSVVRHPSYLGMLLMFVGTVTVHLFSPGMWWVECGMWGTAFGKVFGMLWVGSTVFYSWMLLERVPKEDLMMRKVFKEEWEKWAQKTPYAVIPYFLLISAIVANLTALYFAHKPPQRAATRVEQDKYTANHKTKDSLTPRLKYYVPIRQGINLIFGALHIYAILAMAYPQLQRPAFVFPDPTVEANFYISRAYILGTVLCCSGAYIRVWSFRTLGQFFTYELSVKDDHRLVTTGPYSVVRHPSYLATVQMFAGAIIVQLFSPGTWWIECGIWRTAVGKVVGTWWLGFTVYFVALMLDRVPKEDLMMREMFKEEWDRWAQKTPYAVIPYVW
ncbi:hypothetical protein EIP91_002482 [Steccherinum ochraceum]|uniref:Protein-S-isoprenylcysteine O-methyltransferase n=1 Tax=Steccherinum ochraceum TaxID=92696 RepID=A0A4R0RE19_9APHY|nr:hypothetical protein EIP91_002482 [Steccherinum ochraceum]